MYVVTLSPLALADLNMVAKLLRGVPRNLVPFIVANIWCALRHIHARRIAHRDVKDHNVLLLTDGTPLLVRTPPLVLSYKVHYVLNMDPPCGLD
jgi:serine/threonine protein kinase